MKDLMKLWAVTVALTAYVQTAQAQKVDDERMQRDIEVAENVLSTMIKQEINQNRTFFGLEIRGHYQPGYGVTFRLPGDYSLPLAIGSGSATMIYRDEFAPVVAYSISGNELREKSAPDREHDEMELEQRSRRKARQAMDSAREEYNNRLIKASKDFILDFGDFITQLPPNEKIIVTNQHENRSWYFKENKKSHIVIEALKSDVSAFRQGKLSREQALNKLKVVNTEYVAVKEPDMELLASIFNRLYRPDLSSTYFSDNNMYYERLKDYGVVFYMQTYSSNEPSPRRYSLPTLGMDDVDQETRNQKVIELYPKFEQELKENIVEYGRMLKTLGDDEFLVFNVTLTKCADCKIPSSVEMTVKGSVLNDYNTGKIDKPAAIAGIAVKRGVDQ